MLKHLYEHLKTKKKYNTLEIQKNCIADEYQKKIIELNTKNLTLETMKNEFEEQVEDLIKRLVKEKEKVAELKSKLKEKEEK